MNMKTALIGLLATAFLPVSLGDTRSAEKLSEVSVHITVSKPQGHIMLALYDSGQAYSDNKPIKRMRIAATEVEFDIVLEGLQAGRFAIRAFHDVNDDGKLNTNPFGSPIEPYAFSNKAKPHYGPPAFKDAAFTLHSGSRARQHLSFAQ